MALSKLGVSNDILSIIMKLNLNANVVVKTPFGNTNVFPIETSVEQGTVLGPLLCSGSTAEYVGYNKGMALGSKLVVSSLLFVDDLLDVSRTFSDACDAHECAVMFSKKKKLRCSPDSKCKTIVINKKKQVVPHHYI